MRYLWHVRNAPKSLSELPLCGSEYHGYKLNYQKELEKCLDNIFYTCGVKFSELDLPGRLKDVCVKDHRYQDHIELYYSCDFETICSHCPLKMVQMTKNTC